MTGGAGVRALIESLDGFSLRFIEAVLGPLQDRSILLGGFHFPLTTRAAQEDESSSKVAHEKFLSKLGPFRIRQWSRH